MFPCIRADMRFFRCSAEKESDFMQCPKCGVEIKRFDLSPNCKNCGVSIMYFNQEEELAHDAKKAELEFAKARAVVGRIKETYIGSAPAIVRLVTGVLSVAAFCLPFMNMSFDFPLASAKLSTGAIGVYQMFSDGMLQQLLNLLKAGVNGPLTGFTAAHIVCFVLSVLMILCCFITYLLASINIRRGCKWLGAFAAVSAVADIGATVTMFLAMNAAKGGSTVTVTPGFGGSFVHFALAAALAVSCLLLYKKDPQVEIPEIDRKRIELLAKVKSGEVSVDELPLPVFETEEERQKRLDLFGTAEEAGGKEEQK